MSEKNQAATPLAVDHLESLLRLIPENMRAQTASLNAHTGALYLRPTILASFLGEFSLPKKYQGTAALALAVNRDGIVFTVHGANAIVALQNLHLPTYTNHIGGYAFVESKNLFLTAHITHRECAETLKKVYGANLTYGLSIMAKFAEHLGKGKTSLAEPTRIRIDKSYRKGQQNH